MSDDTEPENYRLSENQTPYLCYRRHNIMNELFQGNPQQRVNAF